ncbi:hypothetical protein GGI07_004986 [Coemansia sp. Benny D115]|nr:hypothetical protein GGI07_004986 [Coemansia sp. Benny D115]
MVGSINMHNSLAQNKENALVAGISRGAASKQTTLLTQKQAGSTNTPLKPGKPTQQLRPGLRQPVSKTPAPVRNLPSTPLQQFPKTLRKTQGLFSPRVQAPSIPSSRWEPEYVAKKPKTDLSRLEAEIQWGCDLDIGLVPKTQSSLGKVRMTELPPLDLRCEEIAADILCSESPSFKWSSKCNILDTVDDILEIPDVVFKCQPRLLVANALNPTRIPRLKRKR